MTVKKQTAREQIGEKQIGEKQIGEKQIGEKQQAEMQTNEHRAKRTETALHALRVSPDGFIVPRKRTRHAPP